MKLDDKKVNVLKTNAKGNIEIETVGINIKAIVHNNYDYMSQYEAAFEMKLCCLYL